MLGRLLPLISHPQLRLSILRPDIRWIATKQQIVDDYRLYLSNTKRDDSILIQCLKSCASEMTSERADVRVNLANKMIQMMKDKNIRPSVQIYNCLLNVYLKNYHSFSPSSFLQQMMGDAVSPNRGTLYLILSAYCQQGNMEAAKQILELIKSNDIPVNEDIYASLITCHAVRGDMDGACELFDSMGAAGIQPGITSYSALLSGYAYNGDLRSISETISSMKTQRAYIGHGHYVDMINALSRGGHPDKIPQLLDSTTNKEWMYNDLLDEAQIFACRSEFASSLCLLKYLSQMDVDKDRQNDLIRSMETSLKLIAENKLWAEAFAFIDEFKESHLSLEDCYEMLIQVTFKSKDWDGLKLVLNEISHQGMTIKPHYFYPPLAGAGVDKDVESGMEWLELMKSFGFGIDRNMMKFMLRAVDNDITKLLNILSDKGFLQAYLPDILLYFCTQGKLQDVTTLCQYITHYSEVLDVDLLLRAVNRSLVRIFYQEPGMIYSEVFKALVPMCGKEQASLLKMCVFNAVQRVTFNSQPKATIDFIRTLWNIQKDIKIAQKDTCKFVLDTFAKRQQLAEFCEFHELVNEYEVAIDCSLYKNILQVAFDLINPSMAVESFNSMKQHKCSISLRDYCNLISTLSKAKRFSQATLYFNEMRKMGYVPFPRVYTRLIIGSLSIGNLTLANNYRSDMQKEGIAPSLMVYNTFIETYAKRGEIERCKEEFKKIIDGQYTPSQSTYANMLLCYCFHGDVTGANEVIEEIKRNSISINKPIISALIQTYINGEDIDGAVEVMIGSDIDPNINTIISLLTGCVAAAREDLKGKVTEKLNSFGFDYEFIRCCEVFALMRCGSFDKCVDIVKANNLTSESITHLADQFTKAGMIDDIKSGIKLLNALGMSSYSLYKMLLQVYSNKKDMRGMMTVREDVDGLPKPDDSFDLLYQQLTNNYMNRYRSSSSSNTVATS